MANTYILIEAKTLTTTTASIEFTSIPSTYTDLILKFTARHTTSEVSNDVNISLNASTSNFSSTRVYGSGSSTGSDTISRLAGTSVGASATANTFANNEIYIPNYTSGNAKSFSVDQVGENNATQAYQQLTAGLWDDTSVINAIKLQPAAGSFVAYSTFYLYGIKKN